MLVSGARGAYDDWTHVIDSGGEPKPSRSAVFPRVGKFTRVCAYDRPGTTRLDGELSPQPRCPSLPPRRTGPRICMPC